MSLDILKFRISASTFFAFIPQIASSYRGSGGFGREAGGRTWMLGGGQAPSEGPYLLLFT